MLNLPLLHSCARLGPDSPPVAACLTAAGLVHRHDQRILDAKWVCLVAAATIRLGGMLP